MIATLQQNRRMQNLNLRIEKSFLGLDRMRAAWDEAAIELGGTIYMSYDWCKTWWEFYGSGKELRILFFYDSDRIVGIVPLYIERFGFGILGCKVARLVGSNIPPKVFNPPIDGEFADRIFAEIVHQFLDCEQCQLLSLGPISEKYGAHLLKAARNNDSTIARIRIDSSDVHTAISLPGSFEDYFRSLTKRQRKNNLRRYDLSLLRQECGAREEIVTDPPAVEAEFSDFVRLHTEEWRTRGGTGHFFSWPDGKEFNQAVVKAQAKLNRVMFVKIIARGRVVASIYGYHFGKGYFAELLAREMDPAWEKYSLGRTIFVRAIGPAITAGQKFVDAGLGSYDYKERLNATEHPVYRIRISSIQLRDAMMLAVINAVRIVLLICYHKIWYRRIRKFLPFGMRKPQWRSWLRFDF